MDRMLIVDLEATCEEFSNDFDNETIEIGAVVVDSSYATLATFQTFCRPVKNPVLSEFCTRLTTITQADVDQAEPFTKVWPAFLEFCNQQGITQWGSWGDYDRKQFSKDVGRHNLAFPDWFAQHSNLKKVFIKSRPGKHKTVGVAKACEMMGVELVPPHHRALSDARSVVAIMKAASIKTP